MYERYVKRLLDVLFSAVLLALLWPAMAVVALLIRLETPGPAIFKQKRYGKDKKFFYIYKFRTMRMDAPRDVDTNRFHDAENYITPLGRILRRYSVDELPQLINILRGDMSFIGPRPALWNQYDLMEWRDRLGASGVRPGLSGWAQVNGRDRLGSDLEKKATLDAQYAQNISLRFDLKCLLWTFIKVVNHQDIEEGGEDRS